MVGASLLSSEGETVKLCLVTLRHAASFRNQSDLLYKVAAKAGFEVSLKHIADTFSYPKERYDRLIALIPLWARYIMHMARLTAPWFSRSHIIYGPVDGPFQQNEGLKAVAKNMRFAAVSKWCAFHCMNSGIPIEGVIRHGIDHNDFKFDKSEKYARLQHLRKEYPNRTIFFSNINPLHRKGLPHLQKALEILDKKTTKKYVFILHTGLKKALKYSPALQKAPHLIIEDAYNKLTFRAIALKTVSCDVYVHPALLEGFGLPILEAMAAKRTIVCLDAPAMNELVSGKEAWLFPYSQIKEERWDNGAIAQLHDYKPEDLAAAMLDAMTQKKVSKEKAAAAYKKSLEYDYRKVYPPLLKL